MSGGRPGGEARRPRVLFVAPVEPWCRENGSSLITADLLHGLAGRDEVDLFSIFVRPPPPGYDRSPPASGEGVLLDIPGLPRSVSALKAMVLRSSPLRHRFDNRRVARVIGEVLSQHEFVPDVVHVEHLPLVDIGIRLSRSIGAPLVYRAHNVESQLWARRLNAPRPIKNAIVRQMERAEVDAVGSAALTICISDADVEWARARAPNAAVDLLPCSLLLSRYDNVRGRAPEFEAQMCFVGGLDWAPNEVGLHWFVHEVLPRVVRAMPAAGLAVLARGATERPWLAENPSVRIVAAEEGAPSLFASSHVSIAPLFQGGGVRIKIPESLAVGCPVVATVIGAEGHDLDGLEQTDDAEEFAAACLRHLRGTRGSERRAALRARVETCYGADGLAARLVKMWTSLAAT